MKIINRFLFVLLMISLVLGSISYSAFTAKAARKGEWSILWLIIPEIDALIDGNSYISSFSEDDTAAYRNLATKFKSEVQSGVSNLNGMNLNLNVTVKVSDIPLSKVTGGNPNDRYPTMGDLKNILDKYAPLREADYDSLIVTSKFTNVPRMYGAVNMGWYSFCPVDSADDIDYYSYNLQLHEWIHYMEYIANSFLSGVISCPSPDDIPEGGYIDKYLKAKYTDVEGEEYLTKFYLELLAGTLPERGLNTKGIDISSWSARPTMQP